MSNREALSIDSESIDSESFSQSLSIVRNLEVTYSDAAKMLFLMTFQCSLLRHQSMEFSVSAITLQIISCFAALAT